MPQQHRHILVVEDDYAIRDALTQVLEDEGYAVSGAANGQEAMGVLHKRSSICLILLDLMMPVMNGWEFRVAQRQDPALAPIPVVVISADASAQDRVAPLDVKGFLRKPVQLDALLDLVKQFCR